MRPEDEPVLSDACHFESHSQCTDRLNCDCACHGCSMCGG